MTSHPSLLARYLERQAGRPPDVGAAAVYAALDQIRMSSPPVADAITRELRDQRTHLKLIASENYASLATQLAQGNWLTDKYAEGIAGRRFYAGCDNVDAIESEAAGLARALFGADHAYVQPHSGATANLIAFLAVLAARVQAPIFDELGQSNPVALSRDDWERVRAATTGQRLLALDYYSGGHLTHGYRFNVSALLFDAYTYTVDRDTGLLDLDQIRAQARQVRPLILLAGYSAYPRKIDFAAMRSIADEVGAVFMVDMAHFAGLVAGGVFSGDHDPVAHAHIVTSTTHKTLRGPRGGLVLCKAELADYVDKGCPAILGGPLPHAMAAKAVALREASQPAFRDYAARIVTNAQALAASLIRRGVRVATGGTDNHLLLVDVTVRDGGDGARGTGLTGRQAESALRACNLTLNRNALPFDANGPWYTSGLRLGTPAVTTLGMGPAEMDEIADIIADVLAATTAATIQSGPNAGKPSKAGYAIEPAAAERARGRVRELLGGFPVYPELDLDLALSALPAEG